jgi:hypothetical protein
MRESPPWSVREWLPNSTTLSLIGVTTTPDGVVVEADGPAAPLMPRVWSTVACWYSRYWRTLKDLAASGGSVTLRVRVSRWRCRNPHCAPRAQPLPMSPTFGIDKGPARHAAKSPTSVAQ